MKCKNPQSVFFAKLGRVPQINRAGDKWAPIWFLPLVVNFPAPNTAGEFIGAPIKLDGFCFSVWGICLFVFLFPKNVEFSPSKFF